MDFKVILISVIAGLVNGGIQMQAHYLMRPKKFHPVIYYAIGSAGCLIAWAACVYYLDAPLWVVGSAAIVWGITGVWDCAVYFWEWVRSKKRRALIEEETQENADTNGVIW